MIASGDQVVVSIQIIVRSASVERADGPGNQAGQALEQLQGARNLYYLLDWAAPPGAVVPLVVEENLDFAAEVGLKDDLRATQGYPPLAPGGWQGHRATDGQEVLIATTYSGRRFLVGHAEWPAGQRMTAGELRAMMGREEVGCFQEVWEHLEECDPLAQRCCFWGRMHASFTPFARRG